MVVSTLPILKRGDPVEIAWVDSAGTRGWQGIDDLEATIATGVLVCRSYGHFFSADDQAITVVLNEHFQAGERTGVGEAMTVPLVAVTGVWRLMREPEREPGVTE